MMKLFHRNERYQKVQETLAQTDSESSSSSSNDCSARSSSSRLSSDSGPASVSGEAPASSKNNKKASENFSKNNKKGRPNNLSSVERAQLATQNGVTRCSECGIKTHTVGRYEGRKAHYYITNESVYEGICIQCDPASVPSKILRQYQRSNLK